MSNSLKINTQSISEIFENDIGTNLISKYDPINGSKFFDTIGKHIGKIFSNKKSHYKFRGREQENSVPQGFVYDQNII